PSGVKDVFEMHLVSGRSIKASANHPFLTLDGWRRLDQLQVGVSLGVPVANVRRAVAEGAGSQPLVAALRRVLAAPPAAESQPTLAGTPRGIAAGSELAWDAIVAIQPLGPQPVFDATVPGTHNFIANGIVTHNSIEQDSDLVIFVYREEYYK